MRNNQHPRFPKPRDCAKKKKPIVKIFKDGREVCNLDIKAGMDEYMRRKKEMWTRQNERCSLQISEECKKKKGKWSFDMMNFEHQDGRGFEGSKRDDRTEKEIKKDGKIIKEPYNSTACIFCNNLKGSRSKQQLIDDGLLLS